jgi:sterol desaturase/sphingolipid hydroxylase (fatty acid hydroxylase superfamily)
MPPSASIPLAVLFYLSFDALLPEPPLFAFFPGVVAGYLVYDMSHYAFHHASLKHPLLKRLKKHHLLHHYVDDTRGFGVSSVLWDTIFRSGFNFKRK